MKTTIHHDQVGFIPETQSWFNMWKEVRATHHINSIKDKSRTIIEIDTEKHLILLKTLNKLRSEGNFFNIIKESENEVVQSCLTLWDPMDCSLPGSSVHGMPQARILEWVAISFSRRSSCPRGWTRVSGIVGRRFTIWATREVNIIKAFTKNLGLASYLMIKPESFPLKIKTRQGWLLLPLLFNTKMQVPARIIRQLKKKKGFQTGKEEEKLFLSTKCILLYKENPKESIPKKIY